ncbi:MAG: ABC transporter ATP-binding protein [Synergistaceae bacterium]
MIKFENLAKSFKDVKVLENINFTIENGNLVAVIGESGCGKTTLLKTINKLIKQTSGAIYINGTDTRSVDDVKLRRNIGYVIQQTGLFPHMTVRENIELIPKLEKKNPKEIAGNTIRLMNMIGMDADDYLDRYPTELSGGQQQRIGVARAFATDPEIILMDEPFSALDPMTRSDLQDELVELQSKLKKTIVFVTHDMDEAIKIADMICIMKDGHVHQYDTPENILKNPIDDFVSDFVGKNRIWSSPEYIKISDIMIEKPVLASESLSLLKCIEKMRVHMVDSLIVIDSSTHKFRGIVKASELRGKSDKQMPAGDFMQTDVPTLSPTDSILDALKVVTLNKLSTIPVVDKDGKLVGLITRSSLVTTLSQQYFDCEEVI